MSRLPGLPRNRTFGLKILPNLITLVRLLLVPAVVYALARAEYGIATGVFVLAGVSDGIDGWLARRFKWSSTVGAWLDAVADKLMVVSTLLMLAWLGALPWWLAGLLFARDVLMFLAVLLYRYLAGDVRIAPLLLGKTHVCVLFVTLSLTLAQAAGLAYFEQILPWAFALAAVTAISSLALYVRVWGSKLKLQAQARG